MPTVPLKHLLKHDTWSLTLRWLVALGVVPALPFAVVALPAALFWLLGIRALVALLFPFAVAMLLYIPLTWVCFLPLYFTVGHRSGHSRDSYVQSAMAAALLVGLGIGGYVLLTFPSPGWTLVSVVFGIIVGVPTAGFIASTIWCTLWSGREPAGTAA
jgi:hypothetical protein